MKSLHDDPGPVVIRFKDDYHATLKLTTDKRKGVVQERDEFFTAGDPYEVALLDDHGEYVHLTFPDGSELHRLPKKLIEVEEIEADDADEADDTHDMNDSHDMNDADDTNDSHDMNDAANDDEQEKE